MTNIRGKILIVKFIFFKSAHEIIPEIIHCITKNNYQAIVLKSLVDKNKNSNKNIQYQINNRINS